VYCPPLKITFLGTGTSSGVPMIACSCEVCKSPDDKDKRYRSSILVESSTTTIVIDTTPDFRSQMLRSSVTKLDAVLITHHHKDHIAGLDDIKAYNYFLQQPMSVYANELTRQALKREFTYIFDENKYPGIPDVNLQDIGEESFIVGDIPITPIKVWHLKMPVLGFRFGNFTYITDANRIEKEEKNKIRGSEILVLNALRHKKHISHFNVEEAIALADELGIPEVYFTHISHQLGKHNEVIKTLPPGRSLAYDLQEINISTS
jgi:phosphoribosyl 1,2-cyclic phosphate phosphodiesterase